MEMAREGEEGADDELGAALKRISPDLDRVELTAKMTGEHDAANAFLEIHPGAGGTESRTGRRCSSGSICGGLNGAVSTSS